MLDEYQFGLLEGLKNACLYRHTLVPGYSIFSLHLALLKIRGEVLCFHFSNNYRGSFVFLNNLRGSFVFSNNYF